MEVKKFDFCSIEIHTERIVVIAINEEVEVNDSVANKIINIWNELNKQPSVILVDRKNLYSYTSDGMKKLTDYNLSNVISTGIIAHSVKDYEVAENQMGLLKEFGRSNMKLFYDLDDALDWAKEIINEKN